MCCFPDENFKMPDKLYPRLAELLGTFVETRVQVTYSPRATLSLQLTLPSVSRTRTARSCSASISPPTATTAPPPPLSVRSSPTSTASGSRATVTRPSRVSKSARLFRCGFFDRQSRVALADATQLSLVIWRQKCWTPLKNQITKAVLELIHNERSNIKVDMTLVRRLLQSYGSFS